MLDMFKIGEKIVVGFELRNKYGQISICKMQDHNPQTISQIANSEIYNIPMRLYKGKEKNQWLFGSKIEDIEGMDQELLVEGILDKAISKKKVIVNGEVFDAIVLLAIYIKLCLESIKKQVKVIDIQGMMFTVEKVDKEMMECFEQIIPMLEMAKTPVYVQSREESLADYMISQPEEIWNHQVLALDMMESYLQVYRFVCNKKSVPQVTYVEKKMYKELEIPQENGENDGSFGRKFLHVMELELSKKITSAIYLLCPENIPEEIEVAIPTLCRNRRVFQGNNLYSKGACLAVKKKLEKKTIEDDFLFLGMDKLRSNVGMQVKCRGEERYLAIMHAGDNWYESKKQFDLILDEDNSLSFLITPIDGKHKKEMEMTLEDLAERSPKMTRIHVEMWAGSVNIVHIRMKDMGFGEWQKASNKVWEEVLEI